MSGSELPRTTPIRVGKDLRDHPFQSLHWLLGICILTEAKPQLLASQWPPWRLAGCAARPGHLLTRVTAPYLARAAPLSRHMVGPWSLSVYCQYRLSVFFPLREEPKGPDRATATEWLFWKADCYSSSSGMSRRMKWDCCVQRWGVPWSLLQLCVFRVTVLKQCQTPDSKACGHHFHTRTSQHPWEGKVRGFTATTVCRSASEFCLVEWAAQSMAPILPTLNWEVGNQFSATFPGPGTIGGVRCTLCMVQQVPQNLWGFQTGVGPFYTASLDEIENGSPSTILLRNCYNILILLVQDTWVPGNCHNSFISPQCIQHEQGPRDCGSVPCTVVWGDLSWQLCSFSYLRFFQNGPIETSDCLLPLPEHLARPGMVNLWFPINSESRLMGP